MTAILAVCRRGIPETDLLQWHGEPVTDTGTDQIVLPLWSSQWAEMWPVRYPYAADYPATEGLHKMTREQAMGKRLIQANPTTMTNLLGIDGDQSDTVTRALSANGSHPTPNLIIENPRNGHAHPLWWLYEPVTRTEFGSLRAIKYAEAVTEGLHRAVDGDRGYSGLLTKNPLHTDWRTHWIHDQPYSLDQLAAGLRDGRNMPPQSWRQNKSYVPQGLGRNCATFDETRIRAYRNVHRYFGHTEGLGAAVLSVTTEINAEVRQHRRQVEPDARRRSALHRPINHPQDSKLELFDALAAIDEAEPRTRNQEGVPQKYRSSAAEPTTI